jgi:hypothetical protein
VFYAGGGGGGNSGAAASYSQSLGGAGGGGIGGLYNTGSPYIPPTSGTANTGGGSGGQGAAPSAFTASGGSGIVIIRYPANFDPPASVVGTLQGVQGSIANGYRVYIWTSSGTITF